MLDASTTIDVAISNAAYAVPNTSTKSIASDRNCAQDMCCARRPEAARSANVATHPPIHLPQRFLDMPAFAFDDAYTVLDVAASSVPYAVSDGQRTPPLLLLQLQVAGRPRGHRVEEGAVSPASGKTDVEDALMHDESTSLPAPSRDTSSSSQATTDAAALERRQRPSTAPPAEPADAAASALHSYGGEPERLAF